MNIDMYICSLVFHLLKAVTFDMFFVIYINIHNKSLCEFFPFSSRQQNTV